MSDRLQRLEEQHAFAERTVEQLNGELIAAYERLDRVVRRVEVLEQALARLAQPDDDEAGEPGDAPGDADQS